MPRIFISYRRADSSDVTNDLAALLIHRYGKNNVFFDIDTLQAGDLFFEAIKEALDGSDVALVMIGSHWLVDRLRDPQDWVRYEVRRALNAPDVRVIPVLLDETPLPTPQQLPHDLVDLSKCHVFRLSTQRAQFTEDASRLIRLIDRVKPSNRARFWGGGGGTLIVALGIALIALILWQSALNQGSGSGSLTPTSTATATQTATATNTMTSSTTPTLPSTATRTIKPTEPSRTPRATATSSLSPTSDFAATIQESNRRRDATNAALTARFMGGSGTTSPTRTPQLGGGSIVVATPVLPPTVTPIPPTSLLPPTVTPIPPTQALPPTVTHAAS